MENIFNHCLKCGSSSIQFNEGKMLECGSCGFIFYRNPAVAVGAFIVNTENRLLLVKRAKDPSKGKLALPGGFIDADETAEEALHREVSEELQIKLISAKYLTSQTNDYVYHGVNYPVLDLFFLCETRDTTTQLDLEEIADARWIEIANIQLEDLAFKSIRKALLVLKERY